MHKLYKKMGTIKHLKKYITVRKAKNKMYAALKNLTSGAKSYDFPTLLELEMVESLKFKIVFSILYRRHRFSKRKKI